MATQRFEITGVKPYMDAIKKIQNGQSKVVSRALNKTAANARSQAVVLLRKHLNLKAKDIRPGLTVKRATWSNLVAVLIGAGKRGVPLIKYAPRPSRPEIRKPSQGVSVQISKFGPRKTRKGSFVARMKSGHVGVFWRAKKGAPRLPIKELFGVGPIQLLQRGVVQRRLRKFISERLPVNLDHEIDYLIKSNLNKIKRLKG
jgi:hypothetical protein